MLSFLGSLVRRSGELRGPPWDQLIIRHDSGELLGKNFILVSIGLFIYLFCVARINSPEEG